jgi:hypothetical protein
VRTNGRKTKWRRENADAHRLGVLVRGQDFEVAPSLPGLFKK